jgi:predicted nucleic acid-binding protein
MGEAVPRVLLDTTALVESGFGRSGAFSHLLRDATDRRVEVILPELVVAEAVFVYRRRLFNIREALEELPSLARAAGHAWDLPQRPALVQRMEEELRRRLTEAGIAPAPAPPVDGDALAKRVLARRKPTKPLAIGPNGRELSDQAEGFRDQLVWEHVRQAAEEGPLVFVTDNTRDFGVKNTRKDGRAQLHPVLLDDLEADRQAGRSSGEVELVLNVATFVGEYLRHEDVTDDMERLLEEGAGAAAAEELRLLVNGDGLGVDIFVPPVAVQGDVEEATLTELFGPLAVELVDAYLESREEEPREYGVTLTVTGEGTVNWVVSAPAPWDLDVFSGLVEGDVGGGGFIQDVDTSPVQVPAYGRYRPSEDKWVALEAEPAEQTAEEVEDRQRRHKDRLFEMERELGLAPSDDEIELYGGQESGAPSSEPGAFSPSRLGRRGGRRRRPERD